MPVQIEIAGEADTQALLAMMRQLYEGEGFGLPARSPQALALLLREPRYGRCFLLREEGWAVGYFVVAFGFSLEFGGRDAFVDELYLIPEARGRGLGRLALDHAVAFCQTEGIHALHLEVSRANRPAQRLYRAAGFRERHVNYDLLTLRMDSRPGAGSPD